MKRMFRICDHCRQIIHEENPEVSDPRDKPILGDNEDFCDGWCKEKFEENKKTQSY